MEKSNLKPGKKYLHKRKTIISGRMLEAERWIRCEEIMSEGAVFSRDFDPEIFLNNQQIKEEIVDV